MLSYYLYIVVFIVSGGVCHSCFGFKLKCTNDSQETMQHVIQHDVISLITATLMFTLFTWKQSGFKLPLMQTQYFLLKLLHIRIFKLAKHWVTFMVNLHFF